MNGKDEPFNWFTRPIRPGTVTIRMDLYEQQMAQRREERRRRRELDPYRLYQIPLIRTRGPIGAVRWT